jgi:hypothetical protein
MPTEVLPNISHFQDEDNETYHEGAAFRRGGVFSLAQAHRERRCQKEWTRRFGKKRTIAALKRANLPVGCFSAQVQVLLPVGL